MVPKDEGVMPHMRTSPHDVLLLRAALAPTSFALKSWNDYCRQHDPQCLADGQTRLLPQVARNLAPRLDEATNAPLLRGLRKATWVRNTVKLQALGHFLNALNLSCDIVLLKGAAIFRQGRDAASRPVGDIDLFVPNEHLEPLLLQMKNMDFRVRHLGTFRDVLERHRFRTIGCNFSHSTYGEIDVHWGVATNVPASIFPLAQQERVVLDNCLEAPGIPAKICGPQVLLAHTIQHLSRQALETEGVLLQALCDIALLASHQPQAVDSRILSMFRLGRRFSDINAYLRAALDPSVSWDSVDPLEIDAEPAEYSPDLGCWPTREKGMARLEPYSERPRLRFHPLYLAWQLNGAKSSVERLLQRWIGPFTRGHRRLCSATEFDFESGCACGAHVGIGWSPWIPTSSGVWSDRSDARLIFRQSRAARKWSSSCLCLTLGREWLHSPYKEVEVFANGHHVGTLRRSERDVTHSVQRQFALPSPVAGRRYVEVSFRPVQFVPRRLLGLGAETHRLGIALRSLAIRDTSEQDSLT